MSSIKLIVGLANPGAEYAATRHNAGAWYVDLLADRNNQSLKEEPKFYGYTARLSLAGEDVRFAGAHYFYEPEWQSGCGNGDILSHRTGRDFSGTR